MGPQVPRREEFASRVGEHANFKKISKLVAEKLADIPLDAPLIKVLDTADTVEDRPEWATKLADAVDRAAFRGQRGGGGRERCSPRSAHPAGRGGKPTAVHDKLRGLVAKLEKAVAGLGRRRRSPGAAQRRRVPGPSDRLP